MKTLRNVENLLRGEEGGCYVPIGMPKYDRPMGTQFLDIVLNGRELRSMYTLHTTVALISTIHMAQIALLYCLKLPVCKPTNGDALHKALNGCAVTAKKLYINITKQRTMYF